MTIQFRPHHFLCALCFQGKGYSPDFVRNFKKIMQEMTDDTIIEVVDQTDSICAPCPSRRETLCTSQEKIMRLDRAHADILQIKAGEKISWAEAKQKIREQMTLEKFHDACAPCQWKEMGMCESVLRKHVSNSSK